MSLERWNIEKVAKYIVDVYNLVSICFLTFVLEHEMQNTMNDSFSLPSWYSLTLNSLVFRIVNPPNQAFTPLDWRRCVIPADRNRATRLKANDRRES